MLFLLYFDPPPYGRPVYLPARAAMLGMPVGPTMGFGAGPALIEPGLGFFAHGHPVGGPSEAYRGVSASTFPYYEVIFGSGAPLFAEWAGIAGTPMGRPPGLHGEHF